MHNLALYYLEGAGGPKNLTSAAQWFRRAADLGLVDSQYNLARLYEDGYGVSQNPAEAYKWYLIAGPPATPKSRSGALRVEPALRGSPRRRRTRRRRDSSPRRPIDRRRPRPVAPSGGDAADIAIAQRALTNLGYYQGPTDGVGLPGPEPGPGRLSARPGPAGHRPDFQLFPASTTAPAGHVPA